ncbi:MAG: MCE family protein [Spirochaetales bacterium]|nr:MCE family protein [Spirochaetales bacterium]
MKFKIRYADQIVGFFVILSLLAFGTVLILLGVNQRWFAKDYYFRSVFSSSANIAPGTPILMKGFQVGKIENVYLNEFNNVDVDLYIYDTYYPKVKEYSLLELSISPVGLGSQLLFYPGLGETLLEEGSFIYTTDSPEGAAIVEQALVEIPLKDDTIARLLSGINPVIENANRTLIGVNQLLNELNLALAGQSTGPIGSMVEDVTVVVSGLPSTFSSVNSIIDELDRSTGVLLGQVEGILNGTDLAVQNVGGITDNLAATTEALRDPTGLIPTLLDPQGSLKTLLDDDNQLFDEALNLVSIIEESLGGIQQIILGVNSEVPQLSSILNETKIAIQQAQDVMEGLKNNPLIRNGIPERSVQESLYNSMRVGEFE